MPPARRGSPTSLAEGSSVDRVEVEYLGRIAERDTRLLTIAVLNGLLAGHTEEEVNFVNAPSLAEERGIEVSERKRGRRARLHRPRARSPDRRGGERVRVVGTTLGRRNRPHLLEAWGQRFNLQMDDDHLALFRYSRRARHDRPRRHDASASTASTSPTRPSAASRRATRAAPARRRRHGDHDRRAGAPAVIDEIVAADGFVAGRALSLLGLGGRIGRLAAVEAPAVHGVAGAHEHLARGGRGVSVSDKTRAARRASMTP